MGSWLTGGGDEDASERQVEQWRQWYRDDLTDRQRRDVANRGGVTPPSGGGGGSFPCLVLLLTVMTGVASVLVAACVAIGVLS